MQRVRICRQSRLEGRDGEFIQLSCRQFHRSCKEILPHAPYRPRRGSRRHTVSGEVEYPRAKREDDHTEPPRNDARLITRRHHNIDDMRQDCRKNDFHQRSRHLDTGVYYDALGVWLDVSLKHPRPAPLREALLS